MTSHEKQTNNIEAKPWNELENPINFVGTPYLDESTVPDEKKPLYDTVLAAHHSAIDQEREDADIAAQAAHEESRQAFLEERRKKALERLDTIAIQTTLESDLDSKTPVEPGPIYYAAPDGSLITEREAQDMREARESRTQF